MNSPSRRGLSTAAQLVRYQSTRADRVFAATKLGDCTLSRTPDQLAQLPPMGYVYLGQIPYKQALSLQNQLSRLRIDEIYSGPQKTRTPRSSRKLSDTIILLQHQPVQPELDRLHGLGCEYFETDRGGEITFHGPGQLVAYPSMYLLDHFLGTKCYVKGLENVVIESCAQFGVDADRLEGFPGVWTSGTEKVAALGTHVRRYVTSHGFALNCTTDLKWFTEIVPCGLEGKTATSLKTVLASQGKTADVSVDTVLPVVVDSFSKVFGCDVKPLEDVSPHTFNVLQELLKKQYI
ncbi:lipoyltransferase [Linderina pennispora]|uniref:lipoyl(octanoyl) transferase n=1 Tax=Linderina pennispora TaxID=61395 RepID=A0A1Y1WML3_9FUNG|nr:lipoyltransferase [Linderina pennispora]ORX74807.1 lipoyltransferase [Linderina pennispora]